MRAVVLLVHSNKCSLSRFSRTGRYRLQVSAESRVMTNSTFLPLSLACHFACMSGIDAAEVLYSDLSCLLSKSAWEIHLVTRCNEAFKKETTASLFLQAYSFSWKFEVQSCLYLFSCSLPAMGMHAQSYRLVALSSTMRNKNRRQTWIPLNQTPRLPVHNNYKLVIYQVRSLGAMASIHLYFAGKQVGDTQKRGKPEMRSSCRKSLDLHWSASPRPCKCPPPQIPVSQSPF